ncbi:MAG: hypothetical protein AAGE01_00560 [Pseudomonadota bacterium]
MRLVFERWRAEAGTRERVAALAEISIPTDIHRATNERILAWAWATGIPISEQPRSTE